MQAKVLGIGNALVDILARIPSDSLIEQFGLHRGGMTLVDEQRSAEIYEAISHLQPQAVSGGSVPNTIVSLANLGVPTALQGKIGRNELAKFFRRDLDQAGVEQHMIESDINTGNCISLISTDSERTMATYLGAAQEMTAADVRSELFEGCTHFYTEGYLVQNPELIEKLLKTAHIKGLTICFDLASYNIVEENFELLQKLIRRYVDVLFANEEEATAFTGKEDTEALNELGELADIVVLKQGCRGSLVKWGDRVVRAGVIKTECIDTTGAGDLYAAGFIYGLINNLSPQKCAEAGAIAAGNVISVIGSKMDTRRWNNIRKDIKKL